MAVAQTSVGELAAVQALYASTVLEDAIDQLAVLGGVMPQGNAKRTAAQSPADELLQLLNNQKQLESCFDEVMTQRNSQINSSGRHQESVRAELHSLVSSLERGTAAAVTIQDSARLAENMAKLQKDRGELQSLLEQTKTELDEKWSFSVLSNTVASQQRTREQETGLIQREKDSVARVQELHEELRAIQADIEIQIHKKNEEIALLKDRLQEMKAKTSLEETYITKEKALKVDVASRIQAEDEGGLQKELESLKKQLLEEEHLHSEMKGRLKVLYEESSMKLEEWSTKYDTEVTEKQEQLDSLQMRKEDDLLKLQQLTEKYHNYKEVVDDEKKRQELLRKQEEQRIRERAAATRMQAWWRGVMVRHELGPYSKKKKKKKGKGSGKKKGKKKKK